jgi:hypothetical protein
MTRLSATEFIVSALALLPLLQKPIVAVSRETFAAVARLQRPDDRITFFQ